MMELLHTERVAILCTSIFGFAAPLPSTVAEAVENVNAGSCRNHTTPPVGGNHTHLLSEVTRPEIAAARRSWLTDSGRGMDKTGRFVRLSRANRPDKIWSSRLQDTASVPPAAPSAVIDSRNLIPASIKPAAAVSMSFPPDLPRAASACGGTTPTTPTPLAGGGTATVPYHLP